MHPHRVFVQCSFKKELLWIKPVVLDLQRSIILELSEKAAGFKEKEKAYWNWLADAKQAVAARPGVAPLYKFDGKSVEATSDAAVLESCGHGSP
eukprot:Skav225416  [mRNA]  locus=scaffold2656:788555:791565:- [translate_table: standard]